MRLAWLAILLAACGHAGPPAQVDATGALWPEADALFHQEPRWLGADAAYSISLGGGRTAWLFGDTFVSTSAAHLRTESTMVRNSVAVQTGLDPTRAAMTFAWGGAGGAPASFFADRGDRWHWPGGGFRIEGGPLLVFLWIIRADSGGLGFAAEGWRAVSIANPDDAPGGWQLTFLDPPAQPWDAVPIAVARDGDFAVGLAIDAQHRGMLARFPLAAFDLRATQWWDGKAWGAGPPAVVIDDAGPEASLHFDAALGLWIHVASRGFGATTIAVRTAQAVTGPWSAPQTAFTPPESAGPSPLVYAGKAHPELATPDGSLAVTYATNSFNFADLVSADGQAHLYWPRFTRLSLRRR